MKKEKIIRLAITLLEITLGDVPPATADQITQEAINLLRIAEKL